ncbi:MAG TPA: hypothetical protein VGQ17_13605 [Gemmatimonadales bacterium]|nr:hypothetical protein [Gemmatimonadales bacterium]
MITGAHLLLFSENPELDRAFFHDVLGFPSVDAGGGWLIFALPPAELALHPADGGSGRPHAGRPLLDAALYLMCDDLPAYLKALKALGVACTPVSEEPWGTRTSIRLPSGGEIGLYQPTHASPLDSGPPGRS